MDKFEKFETNLMYLAEEVASLNNTVTELQADVEKLKKQNEFLNKKIEELDQEDRPSRRPPHY